MKEKHLKRFYESCSKAIALHCKRNGIKQEHIECVIPKSGPHRMIFSYKGKVIMSCEIADEPQIKIKRYSIK